jgi:hypothetical protein
MSGRHEKYLHQVRIDSFSRETIVLDQPDSHVFSCVIRTAADTRRSTGQSAAIHVLQGASAAHWIVYRVLTIAMSAQWVSTSPPKVLHTAWTALPVITRKRAAVIALSALQDISSRRATHRAVTYAPVVQQALGSSAENRSRASAPTARRESTRRCPDAATVPTATTRQRRISSTAHTAMTVRVVAERLVVGHMVVTA